MYEFPFEQYGLQERKRAETAMLREEIAYCEGREEAVVLDLNSAYQSVSCRKLVERLVEKVGGALTKQISLRLT